MKLLALLSAVLVVSLHLLASIDAQWELESKTRPQAIDYLPLRGICEPSSSFLGVNGSLKICANKCSSLPRCSGFNFDAIENHCDLFDEMCSKPYSDLADSDDLRTKDFYLKTYNTLSSSGNEFVVVFMKNGATNLSGRNLEMWLFRNGKEHQTALSDAIVKLNADSSKRDKLRIDQIQLNPGESKNVSVNRTHFMLGDVNNGILIEKKAIKVSSLNPFSLVGLNIDTFSSDGFLGIPVRMLGKKYVGVCSWPAVNGCQMAIAATRNDTVVKVSLPKLITADYSSRCLLLFEGKNYSNGDTFLLKLNNFEVANIQADCNLTGTVVDSTKKIAVWSGNSRTHVGDNTDTRDHLVENLLPVNLWGTDCAAWSTPNRTILTDISLLTASSDNTFITTASVNNVTTFRLNAGNTESYTGKDGVYIQSAKSFQAIQFSKSVGNDAFEESGDPSMIICIPEKYFTYSCRFATPPTAAPYYGSYLTIITTADEKTRQSFLIDDKPFSSRKGNTPWKPFGKGVGYFAASIELNKNMTTHHIQHLSGNVPFAAYVYGNGDRESYAYPCGFNFTSTANTCNCVKSKMAIADEIDNDCDGIVDEELCDGIDNDYDGLIDEDCYERSWNEGCCCKTREDC